MDLFTPVTDPQKRHRNFLNVIAEPEDYARNVLLNWAEGFVDRDGKFVKEFQSSFNSSFWELYIFACLKGLGFAVDFSFQRPDFIVNNDEISFCIEASIASSAVDTPDEWEADYSPETIKNLDKKSIIDFATIRLSNTLTAKYSKFAYDYSGLDQVKGKPFVIAIAPFEQPFSYIQNEQAISRVLYGFDKFIYDEFPERNERIILGQEYLDSITKPNGVEIPLGYFVKEMMNEISAVIFSNTATFGKVRALSGDPGDIFFESIRYNNFGLKPIHTILPKKEYRENLLDGLHIFHNPFADHPISYQFFDRDEITHHDFDFEKGIPLVKTHDGALFQRSTFKLNIPTRKTRRKIYKSIKKTNLKLQKKHVKTHQPLSIKGLEDIFGPF
jgi:hypothetical protein